MAVVITPAARSVPAIVSPAPIVSGPPIVTTLPLVALAIVTSLPLVALAIVTSLPLVGGRGLVPVAMLGESRRADGDSGGDQRTLDDLLHLLAP